MFNFHEFKDYVQMNLVEVLPDDLKDAHIVINEVVKNNGLLLHGLTVTPKGRNIAPNVYLEGYFKQYEEGKELEDVMNMIVKTVVSNIEVPEEFGTIAKDYMNFEFVKDKIVMVAVNAERNANLLDQVPHQNREDLALIYKVLLESNSEGMASITIRNEHMSFWGVTSEQIHELAMENTRKILPVSVQSMNEIMREMFAQDDTLDDMALLMLDDMPPTQQMYVISNSARTNGAASMFYEDTLSSLSEKLGTDLYILPSSVHEVIAVSTDMGTPETLSEMVREVNGSQVSPEEQLSDHVYLFDSNAQKLTLADTTMEEIRQKEMNAAYQNTQDTMQRNRTGVHR